MTSILWLSLTKPGGKSDETPDSTLHSSRAVLAACTQGNVPIKLWRNTDEEGSPPGVRTRITDLVDVVLGQMLEHHAHVEVILHRGPVQPHVELPAQRLGLGPGVQDQVIIWVNCNHFLFLRRWPNRSKYLIDAKMFEWNCMLLCIFEIGFFEPKQISHLKIKMKIGSLQTNGLIFGQPVF